jgi:hypothetical protein
MCLHFWVGNLEERDQSGKKKLGIDESVILKLNLKEQ